jgi:hypothetical protein
LGLEGLRGAGADGTWSMYVARGTCGTCGMWWHVQHDDQPRYALQHATEIIGGCNASRTTSSAIHLGALPVNPPAYGVAGKL